MKTKAVVCGVAIICSTPAWAVDYLSGQEKQYIYDGLSLTTSLGYMGGESREYIYDQGRQLSRLDWKMKNAAILKMEANYDILPWLSINAAGWTSLAAGSGSLKDRDWQDLHSTNNTDTSFSSATLNEANEYDLSLRGWIFNSENYKAGIIAGYQESRFSMTAKGGTYDYAGTDANDTYDPNLPRVQGTFPANQSVVGYKQTYRAPYLGLIGKYAINDFEFNALMKYSHWVDGKDNDNHYLNNATSAINTSSAELWAGQINAGYWVTPQAKVFTEADYTYYPNKKGKIEQWDNDGYQSASSGGGIQNRNWTITAGLQYLW
ncbi:omptin family outer membrane protease [Scandinavium goeteborgense]|uniref:omptin family outer membrane protease n=1 Tax=Scandinavium goeteborgense TaxID=1851514 RepID=UPI002166507A|nr:omptin family outer membrane protease [Scandinavium goeteborgense]MCS2154358.1 omptin family outer membrane protease [Scandinavium goeteborgense]